MSIMRLAASAFDGFANAMYSLGNTAKRSGLPPTAWRICCVELHEMDFVTDRWATLDTRSEDHRMTETIKAWRAEPLTWGRGPRQFEMFLEPTCPYSARAFAKVDETLASAGSDNIAVKIHLHSQPWHMYSGVIVRCILAASTLPTGKEAAKAVLAAVAAHREEFEFTKHCSGPNMDASPKQIIARLENYCGLKLADAFAIPNLDREIKKHTKYARQNGIHVSPTFMIDGLVQPDMSSGDKVSDWVARLLAN